MGVNGAKMRPRRHIRARRFRASTIVELVVALTALVIIVLGHSITGYNARLDIKRSMKQSAGVMTALLLSESWAGVEGAAAYDPRADLEDQLTFTAASGPSAPAGFTSQGSYCAVVNDVSYYATLSSNELAPTLRALNVTVAWADRDGSTTPDRSFSLTTYVLLNWLI